MAVHKPGRLRRVLTPIIGTQWAFTMSTGTYAEADETIHSVNITRGVSGRNVGHNPTTCEISVMGRKDSFDTGKPLSFIMRQDAASRLGSFLGIGGEEIAQRFRGRLGAISLEDTGTRFTTSVAGSSFLTQMNYSPASFTPGAGQNLGSLLLDMTKANEPIRGIDFGTMIGLVNMVHYPAGERTLFRDGVSKYAADIGIQLQERRDGSTLAWSHYTRYDLAAQRLLTEWPLMRNQAIAPGEYSQQNERPAKRVAYTITNSAGGQAERIAEVSNPTGELRETESVDWSDWQVSAVDNQLYREAYARVFESSARLFTMPTVKIDMLMLLRGGEYSKRIARQILSLQVGEPIFLSGDWPPKLQGVHFAEGIKESINSEQWLFELSLVPHAVAVGRTSPSVPARAWDSATAAWDQETREWNEA